MTRTVHVEPSVTSSTCSPVAGGRASAFASVSARAKYRSHGTARLMVQTIRTSNQVRCINQRSRLSSSLQLCEASPSMWPSFDDMMQGVQLCDEAYSYA